MDYEQRVEALERVVKQINSEYGKGALMRLGSVPREKMETVPSGALTLDLALGGGYPKGRIIEILALKALERQPWPFTPLQKFKSAVVLPVWWMLSMPSITHMERV